MLVRILMVALSSLCFAISAAADGPYVAMDVGPAFFADSDVGGFGLELEYDPGFHIGGAIGARFLDQVRVEGNASYRQADIDEVSGGIGSASGEVGIFAALANGYLDLDVGLPVTPYLGAGIGLGVVMVDAPGVDDSSTEFAWNVMGGVSYALTPEWALTGGYRYFSTTDADIEGADVEIGVHELMFGARYEF